MKRRDCGAARRRAPGHRRWSAGLLAALAAGAVAEAGGRPEDPRPLARSIYVPVVFEVAPCLDRVLVRNDEGRVRAVAPGRLVSQFTWYGGRRGLDPEWERLTIEGDLTAPAGAAAPEEDTAPAPAARFRAEIVITPTSIYYGRRRLALDPDLSGERGRDDARPTGFPGRRADFRFEDTKLLLRPAGGCPRRTLPAVPSPAVRSPADPR